MSTIVQQRIVDVTEEEVKRWRKIGVKIDGTRVVQIPEEYGLALGRLEDLGQMLSPEFQIGLKTIEPEYLSLCAKATKAPGIDLYFRFEPFREKNESGYKGSVNFRLSVKDYPSYAPQVLDLQSHSGCKEMGNETRSSEYKFTQRTKRSHDGPWYVLEDTVGKMKLNLRVALALREYEMRHS
jgi:hypothetical protein